MPVVYRINSVSQRNRLIADIQRSPLGYSVEIKRNKRSVPQNSRMWAMLTDVSQQLAWHGEKLAPEDWKCLFMHALERELRVVPGLSGGTVVLGFSSSSLSVAEMTELMDLIEAFGGQHGVVFSREAEDA